MTDNDKQALGQRIKQIRLEQGLTMAEFGSLVDRTSPASDSIVSRWERGISSPNSKRMKSIANLGNVSMEYLLTGHTFGKNELDSAIKADVYNFFEEKNIADFSKDQIALLASIAELFELKDDEIFSQVGLFILAIASSHFDSENEVTSKNIDDAVKAIKEKLFN